MSKSIVVSLPDHAEIAEHDGMLVLPAGARLSSPGGLNEMSALIDAVMASEGPSETFAASAPRDLIAAIRQRTPERGAFSRFVTRAIANELVDERRREVLAAMIAEGAEVDPDLSTQLQTLFARPSNA